MQTLNLVDAVLDDENLSIPFGNSGFWSTLTTEVMNYAAVLAFVMVFAFSFPVLVRIANSVGVARSTIVISVVLLAFLLFLTQWVRMRVSRYRTTVSKIEQAKAQTSQSPNSDSAYYVGGEHLGELLLRVGKRREAIAVYERFLELQKTEGKDVQHVITRLQALRSQEEVL